METITEINRYMLKTLPNVADPVRGRINRLSDIEIRLRDVVQHNDHIRTRMMYKLHNELTDFMNTLGAAIRVPVIADNLIGMGLTINYGFTDQEGNRRRVVFSDSIYGGNNLSYFIVIDMDEKRVCDIYYGTDEPLSDSSDPKSEIYVSLCSGDMIQLDLFVETDEFLPVLGAIAFGDIGDLLVDDELATEWCFKHEGIIDNIEDDFHDIKAQIYDNMDNSISTLEELAALVDSTNISKNFHHI